MLGSTALLVLAALQAPAAQEAPEELDWGTDLGAATARAGRDGRPLLLVFR